jgi:hypothetical protein
MIPLEQVLVARAKTSRDPDEGARSAPGGAVERRELERFLGERLPHHRLVEVAMLGADADQSPAVVHEGDGHGVPMRLGLVHEVTGHRRDLVLRFAAARASALDFGVVDARGRLCSLREAGEPWLLTDWVPGRRYAEDLRRIAASGVATAADVERARSLARHLLERHTPLDDDGVAYARAIRDLVGHDEGVFGIVDGYPDDVPGVSPGRLEGIEAHCVAWRWSLKGRGHRLARIHGDFHPFNVLLGERDAIAVLDSHRGGKGEPADDVACMAIHYLFFALRDRATWAGGFAPLWYAFWSTYLDGSGDAELTQVVAPFLAWRALVLCSPRGYPDVDAAVRSRLLGLVEHALESASFVPESAEELFR